MIQLTTILKDSLRQAADRRAFVVMLVLALLVVGYCAGISMERPKAPELIRRQAEDLGSMEIRRGMAVSHHSYSVTLESVRVRRVEPADDLPGSMAGGWVAMLDFADAARLDRFARAVLGDLDRVEPAEAGAWTEEALNARFAHEGWPLVRVDRAGDDPTRFRVALAASDLGVVRGPRKHSQLFGLMELTTSESPVEVVTSIQSGILSIILGSFGVLVSLVVCAGFIPDMLAKGSLDLVLARPIGRGRLLLYKYAGSLWFILLVALAMVGGSWLMLRIRTGYAAPGYLAAVPLVTLIFAVLFSVVTLFGVLVRSPGIATLMGLATWGFSSAVTRFHDNLAQAGAPPDKFPGWVLDVLQVLYLALPKTLRLELLGNHLLMPHAGTRQAQDIAEQVARVDWLLDMGTTGLFTCVVLGLAVWVFQRRDW